MFNYRGGDERREVFFTYFRVFFTSPEDKLLCPRRTPHNEQHQDALDSHALTRDSHFCCLFGIRATRFSSSNRSYFPFVAIGKLRKTLLGKQTRESEKRVIHYGMSFIRGRKRSVVRLLCRRYLLLRRKRHREWKKRCYKSVP